MVKCNCDCESGSSSHDSKCVTNDAQSSVYACAGASNVGMISMDLTIALHKANRYKMGCSVCIGAGDCNCTDIEESTNRKHLLIDGCKTGCLKKMFDNKGISNYNHVIITQMGIAKEPTFDYEKSIIAKLLNKLTEKGL
jgi:uncharacterized metal-binding protein